MPLINYSCQCGTITKKFLRSAKDSAVSIVCPKCGLEAKKVFGTTSSSYKVTIDLPGMARAVHVDPNIQEINDEVSQRDFSEED